MKFKITTNFFELWFISILTQPHMKQEQQLSTAGISANDSLWARSGVHWLWCTALQLSRGFTLLKMVFNFFLKLCFLKEANSKKKKKKKRPRETKYQAPLKVCQRLVYRNNELPSVLPPPTKTKSLKQNTQDQPETQMERCLFKQKTILPSLILATLVWICMTDDSNFWKKSK